MSPRPQSARPFQEPAASGYVASSLALRPQSAMQARLVHRLAKHDRRIELLRQRLEAARELEMSQGAAPPIRLAPNEGFPTRFDGWVRLDHDQAAATTAERHEHRSQFCAGKAAHRSSAQSSPVHPQHEVPRRTKPGSSHVAQSVQPTPCKHRIPDERVLAILKAYGATGGSAPIPRPPKWEPAPPTPRPRGLSARSPRDGSVRKPATSAYTLDFCPPAAQTPGSARLDRVEVASTHPMLGPMLRLRPRAAVVSAHATERGKSTPTPTEAAKGSAFARASAVEATPLTARYVRGLTPRSRARYRNEVRGEVRDEILDEIRELSPRDVHRFHDVY